MCKPQPIRLAALITTSLLMQLPSRRLSSSVARSYSDRLEVLLHLHSIESTAIVCNLGKSDSEVENQLDMKTLSPDEVERMIEWWWGMLEIMMMNSMWLSKCFIYHPVPTQVDNRDNRVHLVADGVSSALSSTCRYQLPFRLLLPNTTIIFSNHYHNLEMTRARPVSN